MSHAREWAPGEQPEPPDATLPHEASPDPAEVETDTKD